MSKWLVLVLSSLLSFGAMAQAAFVEGKDYVAIKDPVRTSDPSKVEVTEVFWYGCGHCNNFRPIFEQWENQQAEDVTVLHSPAMWNKNMEVHAAIYYTAEVLGKQKEMHKPIFDAMHIQKKRLLKSKEISALFAEHGVENDEFEKTFKSFGVRSMVQQAGARARGYGITGTPEVIVNGKYRTSASMSGSHPRMLQVVDFLVAKERAELGS